MLRLLILGIFPLLLCCCSVGDSFAPSMNWYYKLPQVQEIQRWQKPNSIGNTNSEQRWGDFQECGVKKNNAGILGLNGIRPDESVKDADIKNGKIVQCIKNKGYIFVECVDFDKKMLNGKCN